MGLSFDELSARIRNWPSTPAARHATRITAVDTHTAGEPTRIVVSGYPEPRGDTMLERKRYYATEHDDLRRALMFEPRGHRDMFGAVLMPPTDDRADVGVVYMDTGGYLNMCGHGTIGVSAMLAATGAVQPSQDSQVRVRLDTPAGLVRAEVEVDREDGSVQQVTVENVPAYVDRWQRIVHTRRGDIPVTIAFGGSFFALVDPRTLGLPLEAGHIPELIDAGMDLLAQLRRMPDQPVHPVLDIRGVDLVEFSAPSATPGVDVRNVVVFGDGQVDRSPCGTGSSARVAELCAAGRLRMGEQIVVESLTGSQFRVAGLRKVRVGHKEAIVPQISGNAYITGVGDYILDTADPNCFGFQLGARTFDRGSQTAAA